MKIQSNALFMLSFMHNFGAFTARRLGDSDPDLKNIAVDPTQKLQLCEGDCDNDTQCAGKLQCFQRSGYTPVPGCSLVGSKDWDYCINPDLNYIAANPTQKLDLCEGDCDNDTDCVGDLQCFKRDGYTPVPGCTGNGRESRDYCIYPELNSIAGSPTQTLQLCEGDCDDDTDCAGDLECFHRNAPGGFTPVPGCTGTGVIYWDYCINPELNNIAVNPTQTLQACEGDCDNDTNCAGDLECFQRDGFTPVPGCSGAGNKDWDYCIHPHLNSIAVTPTQTLQFCEGDCDRDTQCAGDLQCFHRNALQPVPDCKGTGRNKWDYCVYPEPFTVTGRVGGRSFDTGMLGEYKVDKMYNGLAAYTNGNYFIIYDDYNGWKWVRGSYSAWSLMGPKRDAVANAQTFVKLQEFQITPDVVYDYAPFTVTAQVWGEEYHDPESMLGEYTFNKMWNGEAEYASHLYVIFYGGSAYGWQWVTYDRYYNYPGRPWTSNGPSLFDVPDAQAFVEHVGFELL